MKDIPVAYGSIGNREDAMVDPLKERIKTLQNLLRQSRNLVLKNACSDDWPEEWLEAVNTELEKRI